MEEKQIQNYIILGVIATIFCCPFLGVISVIYAGKTNTALATDNTAAAILASEKSKFWGIVSLFVGAAMWAAFILSMILVHTIR